VIEGIDLRRSPHHKKKDHRCGAGGKMGLAGHIRLQRIDISNAPGPILRHRLPQLQIVKCKRTHAST
jgi:hypothetical protein